MATENLVRLSLAGLIDEIHPDLVYGFNGRFAESAPVVSTCRSHGVPFYMHDLGYEQNTFRIVPGGTIHNLEYTKRLMSDLWGESHLDPDRDAIARSFFEGRRFGGIGDAEARYQWAKNQQTGVLPADFDDADVTHRIAIFVSSEDELTSLADYQNPIYLNQLEGFRAIMKHPWPPSTHIYVRSHPNLKGLKNSQTRLLDWAASLARVTVIPSGSDIDSYALAERSDVVLTFGSTVGIESAYWGTSTVLAGRAVWEDLLKQHPHSHDEVVHLLTTPPPPDTDPLPYGYLERRWGHQFTRFAPWPSSLTGLQAEPSGIARLQSRLERFFDTSGGVVGRILGSDTDDELMDEPVPWAAQ